MTYVFSIAATAVLFILLILLLSVKPSIAKKITFGSLALAGISGFLIYGYGYAVITDNVVLAVLKALLAVCASFVGGNEFGAIASVPIMQTLGMQIFCTFIRICALYATASAIITTIGREALKNLRLWLTRRGTIHVIYGDNDDALAFGGQLAGQKRGIVVFVSETAAASATISARGCVLKTDTHAVNADGKFLRSIGFHRGGRAITLYALNKNFTANVRYATKLLDTLQACGASEEQLRLVVLGPEETAVSHLQKTATRYGYGYVTAVDEPQMAARLLTRKYPPCNAVAFDENGKATEDFDALLVGFGHVGQAVLKAVAMNAQFEGSTFRMAVFAPDYANTDGRFADQFGTLCEAYDISFHGYDARSRKLYDYLAAHRDTLKYVAVCTGREDLNREIAEDIVAYFHRFGRTVPVYQCSRKGVEAYAADGTVAASHNVYQPELLCSDRLDRMAMILNHRYQGDTEKTALQQWMACDYFSRQSCRASADFVPAMLRAAGKTADQAVTDWHLTDAQKENLSKTEHRRWCAFHYAMGFSAMTDEEFEARAEQYRQEVAQHGKATVRLGKNMQNRTHACLVDWDALDILSEKEAAITGKRIDYQAMDTENVMAIPELLQTV